MAGTLHGWRAQTNAKRSRESNQRNVGCDILNRPSWLREMVVLVIPSVRDHRCYVVFRRASRRVGGPSCFIVAK